MGADREDVLSTWLAAADAASTITLCGSLAEGPGLLSAEDVELAASVGREARSRFPANIDVLLAVARMYVRTNDLEEARWTMAHATAIAADDPRPFGLLGEVLLRLGDARRSAAAFEAAVARGADDAKTLTWQEQAREFIAIQDAHGEQAVAKEAMVALGVTSPTFEEPEAPPARRPSRPSQTPAPGRVDAYVRTSTEYSVVSERTRRSSNPGRSIHEETTRKSASSDLLARGRRALEGDAVPVEKAGSLRDSSGARGRQVAPAAQGKGRVDTPVVVARAQPVAPDAPPPSSKPRSSGGGIVLGRLKDLPPPSERKGPLSGSARAGKGPPPLPEAVGDGSHARPAETRPRSSADITRPDDHPRAAETQRTPTLPNLVDTAALSDRGPRPMEAKRAPVEAGARAFPWSQWARRIAIFVIAAGILALGAVEALRRYGLGFSGTTDARAVVEVLAVESALRSGGPAGLTLADEALERARAIAPTSVDVAITEMRVRSMYAVEGDEPAARLTAAIEAAKARGAPESQLGTARIAEAVATRNTASIDELLTRYDRDARAPFAKALHELVAGAALELKGDARAITRYQNALDTDSQMFPAEVRLIRAMLLYGDVAEGRRRARALGASTPGRAEAAALLALASMDEARAEQLRTISAAAASFAELPRPHRSLVRALEVTAQVDPAGRAEMLAAAVAAADSPAVAAFCGSLALAVDERGPAEAGAKRALELAPAYPQALVLSARVALAAGQLGAMQEAAARLDPGRAAEFQAVLAYETADLAALQGAVRTLAGAGGAGKVCAAAEERLRGAKRLTRERLLALAGADRLWGDLVAVDAALDAGDLLLAAELTARWSDPKHPLRAARTARRLRYEGKLAEAREAAAAAAPTPGGLLEQLALGRSKAERAPSLAAVASGSAPASRWLHIYGMALDGGAAQALAAAGALDLPDASAPLPVRVLAGLALAQLKEVVRATTLLIPLVSALPGHPDVIRAAVGVRLLPEEALKHR